MNVPNGSLVARVMSVVVVTVLIFACGPRESGPITEKGVDVPADPGAAEPAEPPPVWGTDPWGDFKPMPTPGPGDWLAVQHGFGQSFEAFVHAMPNRPDDLRATLILQPLGRFDHRGGAWKSDGA